MKEAGLKCVRIGEFAWHKMEPKEGQFSFGWLHRVMDKLGDAGISVVLGTPSATPPIWLTQKDPDMLRLSENGRRESHGGRRHCCSNNETYRKYSIRIAEKMAEKFGKDKRVVGWQIDNEIYIKGLGCFCEECQKGFRKYLENKYGTVEKLNERWNLNLFSQWYDSFEQVQIPGCAWTNPHLLLDWNLFQMRSHIEFVRMQVEALRKFSMAPIGTDMMPYFAVDHEEIAEMTDVMQFNHYNDEYNLWMMLMWFDYMRGLSKRPFWNTETSTCWNGSTATPENIRPDGFCRVNSWLPIALGGESNFYWLWRQHWAGHELMHGAVLYASGRPMHIFPEVQETAAGYEKCGDFLSGTRVKTDVAFMLSTLNHHLMVQQSIVREAGDLVHFYRERANRMYKQIAEYGMRPDVIGTKKALDDYKLLITPFMMTLEIGDLQERIAKWVRGGGTWIVGPMTDIRNDIGAHYKDKETGILEEMTGAVLTYQVPDAEHRIKCTWTDGQEFGANTWLQLFDLPESAEAIATVNGTGYAALQGKAVVFKQKVGKGTVLVLGTIPSEADMQKILDLAVQESGAQHFDVTGTAAVAYREGKAGTGYVIVGYSEEPATVKLDGKYQELISGEILEGAVTVPPYQVAVVKKL